jgi:predicted ribosomally synthesized peptide with nif11-like leader
MINNKIKEKIMSLANVQAFYQRLANDEAFRSQIQNVQSKEECSQIVKAAGYNFTLQEYEEYTAQLLDSDGTAEELQDLNERELEAVFGGGRRIIFPGGELVFPGDKSIPRPIYGLPYPSDVI